MSITPFLRDNVFEPETIDVMGDAFTQVCNALGLTDRTDKLTEVVARRIIELAADGMRTKTALYLATMQEFKANPQ